MKYVVAYIQSQLLSCALFHAIEGRKKASFNLVPEIESSPLYCKNMSPDIFIAEVRDYGALSLERWYERIEQIKKTEKKCKIIFITDRDRFPEAAEQIKEAYREKKIDLFFYMIAWPDYIADVVTAM